MTQLVDGLPSPARVRAMLVIILGIVMSALDGTVVNLALPVIARDLQVSAASSVWVVNAYQLAALTLLLPFAALGDRIGYRRVYLLGVAVFATASAICLCATSLPILAGGRGLQGMGAAGIMAVNGALLRLIFPRHLLGRGVALNAAIVATATVAGPTLAAAVLSVASWPWLFVANIPLGALVLFLGWRALPHNAQALHQGTGFPFSDALFNVLMFALVFVGAHMLGSRAGGSPQLADPVLALGLLATGLAVGVLHLRRQWHLANPLFPVDLLRIPSFALSLGTSMTAFVAQTLAYVALPFLLLDELGRSPVQAGFVMSAWPLAVVLVVPITGRMIGRYHSGLLGGLGLGIMALGLAMLALLPSNPGSAGIAWRLAMCGVGFGLFQSPNNHTILTSAPIHRSGAAGGMLGTARLAGQTVAAVLLVFIFGYANADDRGGTTIALWLAAVLSGVGGIFSSLRMWHRPKAGT